MSLHLPTLWTFQQGNKMLKDVLAACSKPIEHYIISMSLYGALGAASSGCVLVCGEARECAERSVVTRSLLACSVYDMTLKQHIRNTESLHNFALPLTSDA